MGGDERRTRGRVAMKRLVDCHHEGNYLVSHSKDISPDGMFLCSDAPLPVGSLVKLVFSVDGLHDLVVAARVVRSVKRGSCSQPGMGLEFIDLPENLREALLDILHRVAVLDDESPQSGTA